MAAARAAGTADEELAKLCRQILIEADYGTTSPFPDLDLSFPGRTCGGVTYAREEGWMRMKPSALTAPTLPISEYIDQAAYANIPPSVIEAAKALVADSLANAVGGSRLEPGRLILQYFTEMGGAPEATVLANGRKLPLAVAAYVNSYLTNNLDFDDTYMSFGHPGATNIPAALAVAEMVGASGREFLNAVVVAYEVSLRIGLATRPSSERYKKVYGMSTWQVFGAVAAAAKLFRLDTEKVRHALGLAGVNAPVPYTRKLGLEVQERPFSWSKNNFGWATMGGVVAADLARRGFLGNRFILDGDCGFWTMAGSDQVDWPKFTEGLGQDYWIVNTSYKPFASCRWTHSTIDAMGRILARTKIDADRVRRIRVRSFYETVVGLAAKRPQNIIDAQFSIPFLLAATMRGHSPTQGLWEEDLEDPEVWALAGKVEIFEDDEASEAFFNRGEMQSTVTVELVEGNSFEERVTYPKGDPKNPLTREEAQAKFTYLVEPVLGKGRTRRMWDDLKRLESAANMREVVAGWVG